MRKDKRAAAVQQAEAAPETAAVRVPFEELIRGEYAADFHKKCEELFGRREEDCEAAYTELLRSVEEARRAYPDFELRRELGSPQFASMVLRGVSARSAGSSPNAGAKRLICSIPKANAFGSISARTAPSRPICGAGVYPRAQIK